MTKKRTFLVGRQQPIPDNLWKELLSLSKTFRNFIDGHSYASYQYPKWERKFLDGMASTASQPSHWIWVCNSSKPRSGYWNLAVKELFKSATEHENNLNQWKRLRSVLPKEHALTPKVREKISQLKKGRKAAKQA